MKHLTIYDLNEDQLKEAKSRLYEGNHPEGVSMDELLNIDDLITDREAWEEYRGTVFVPEDFAADPNGPKKEGYRQHRDKTQKESDDFLAKYAFFAFNEAQFAEGLQKLNIAEADAKDKLAHLLSGCYILKDHKADYLELMKKASEDQRKLFESPLFAYDALLFELENHEYSYTLDEEDALDSLGLSYEEDIAPDVMLAEVFADATKAACRGSEDEPAPRQIMAELIKAANTSTIKGSLGLLTVTAGIEHATQKPEVFDEVAEAIRKYCVKNWGDTDEEDKPLNDAAAEDPGSDRLLAMYHTSAGDIFIITEYDRSATTVLFASEY